MEKKNKKQKKNLTICFFFILYRLEVQEVQISQMQMELTTLGQVQLEFEEYKKKVEASSRYRGQRCS